MSSSVDIKLFATHPHSCSYLDDQQAMTVFVDPEAKIDLALYSHLSTLGFRRSGAHIYRPQCAQCQACIPVRLLTLEFTVSRSHKRILKKNQGMRMEVSDTGDHEAFYQLYRRYIEQRHNDGDMYPPSREQYNGFLSSQWGLTRYLAAYQDDRLIGVAVCDLLNDGLSAVYTFFEPDMADRSLGSWFILQQIRLCQTLGLPHLYLGYWIEACNKMNYKSRFKPQERFINGIWVKS